MNIDLESLTQTLQKNLELNQVLSSRIEMLENQVEENAGQRMAAILLLRAVVQCSENRDEVVALVERMTAQMQVQPGILAGGGKNTLMRAKKHLDWIAAPPPSLD